MNSAPAQRDPNLAKVLRDVVAVVYLSDGQLAIWHVDVGPDSSLARMAGAWVLPAGDAEKAVPLLQGRRILATPQGRAPVEALFADLDRAIDGFVDVDATLKGIDDVITDLQAAFEAEVAGRKAKLVNPAWPTPPAALDVAALERSVLADGGDPVTIALGVARWLEGLAKTWEKVEAQRVTRSFLVSHGGKERRSLPVQI